MIWTPQLAEADKCGEFFNKLVREADLRDLLVNELHTADGHKITITNQNTHEHVDTNIYNRRLCAIVEALHLVKDPKLQYSGAMKFL